MSNKSNYERMRKLESERGEIIQFARIGYAYMRWVGADGSDKDDAERELMRVSGQEAEEDPRPDE